MDNQLIKMHTDILERERILGRREGGRRGDSEWRERGDRVEREVKVTWLLARNSWGKEMAGQIGMARNVLIDTEL